MTRSSRLWKVSSVDVKPRLPDHSKIMQGVGLQIGEAELMEHWTVAYRGINALDLDLQMIDEMPWPLVRPMIIASRYLRRHSLLIQRHVCQFLGRRTYWLTGTTITSIRTLLRDPASGPLSYHIWFFERGRSVFPRKLRQAAVHRYLVERYLRD